MPEKTSGVPRLALRLSLVALAAFVLGPIGAHFGLTKPLVGLAVFALGGVLGLAALVLGIIGAIRHTGAGRSTAARGLAIGAIIGVIFGELILQGRNVPRINDITTDTDHPPKFTAALDIPENAGRDMGYPGASFAEQQKTGYPDLAPLPLAMPPADAYAKVKQRAAQMPRWVIIRDDPSARVLEGNDTSQLFRFKDDFIIEVRDDGGGKSDVEMRSKSRDGQGDFGVNAKRIRSFFANLQ